MCTENQLDSHWFSFIMSLSQIRFYGHKKLHISNLKQKIYRDVTFLVHYWYIYHKPAHIYACTRVDIYIIFVGYIYTVDVVPMHSLFINGYVSQKTPNCNRYTKY